MFYSKKSRSNAIAAIGGPSQGAPTGFAENFAISATQETLVDSFRGYEHVYSEYEQQNLTKIYEITGEKLEPPRAAQTQSRAQGVGVASQYYEEQARYEKRLQELAEQYPGQIQTKQEITERVKKLGQAQEAEMLDVAGRQTAGGKVGEFLGAAFGSFNPETQPMNIATLPIGSVATKNLLLTLGKEFGINFLVEGVNQLFGVSENRLRFGLPATTERAFMNMAAAGFGGAALKGAGIGIATGVKKLRDKYGAKTIEMPASQLADEFESSGSTLDNAVEFGLQREAMDEPLVDGATPQTVAIHQQKINEVESAIIENRPINDDVFPDFSIDRVRDDLQRLADTLDIDLATATKRVEMLQKQIQEAQQANKAFGNEVEYMDRVTIPARKYGLYEQDYDAPMADIVNALEIIRRGDSEVERPLMKLARDMGGVADEAGELRNMGVTGQTYPGFLNNRSGTRFDMFREAAEERGLVPPRSTTADILEAMEFEVNAPGRRSTDAEISQADQFLDELGISANEALANFRKAEGPEIKALKKERAELQKRLQDQGILDEAGREAQTLKERADYLNAREDALLEAYSKNEIAELDREIREIAAGAPENRSLVVERTDGEMETVRLKDVLDELDRDRAILDSMKVCGL